MLVLVFEIVNNSSLSPFPPYYVLKKVPASITLSLPVINNAKNIRIVLMGADKREALLQGLRRDITPFEFPVCGVDSTKAVWLVDKACAENIESSNTSVERIS
jgi:6-phosphogluconolactonase/glucosamine-6-phosphate isomerase/deaminase